MERILLLQILEKTSSSSSSIHSPPPPTTITDTSIQQSPSSFNLDSKITPSILLIIVILAIIFFVSGLLHLLVRFLLRPNTRSPDESDTDVTALQGQLQQLFHLHDAGVDQSFIDTLPVFHYKAIIGVKDPFDCAVCLCEFEPDDKLRLLPKCSHAFHMYCIDTWLLSHSTCPLCRASLVPESFLGNSTRMTMTTSPIVCVLESGRSDDVSTEIGGGCDSFRGEQLQSSSNRIVVDFPSDGNLGEKIVTVKLGKFKSVDGGSGEGSSSRRCCETNNNNNSRRYCETNNSSEMSSSNSRRYCETNNSKMSSNSRRCFSMGSFAYVMDEKCSLQVPIEKTETTSAAAAPANNNKAKAKKAAGGFHFHRSAVSEYGSDSRREFNGIEAFKSIEIHETNNNNNNSNKTSSSERFSISKIWARGGVEKKEAAGSRRSGVVVGDVSRRTISEIEIDENDGGESWLDEHSCYSMDSMPPVPSSSSSSSRRTLLWLMGRQQNKVIQPPSNV